jgi:hypothetical protein
VDAAAAVSAVSGAADVAGESHVAMSQTSAVAPSKTETDPARHAWVRAVISAGWARDRVGAGAGGWAHRRLPPVGVTETFTKSPLAQGCGGGGALVRAVAGDEREHRRALAFDDGVPGLGGAQIRPDRPPRYTSRGGLPRARSTQVHRVARPPYVHSGRKSHVSSRGAGRGTVSAIFGCAWDGRSASYQMGRLDSGLALERPSSVYSCPRRR